MNNFKKICIRGARHHNLKNISIDIPKNCLIVITGPSGCGKSTIAMDIIYAEGQRRYLESLPSYARQFLTIPEKSNIESISGLSPSIAIDQKTVSNNIRSTVGTVTEIYEYLRVLFSTIGTPHCIKCHKTLSATNPDVLSQEFVNQAVHKKFKKLIIAAPIIRESKGIFKSLLLTYIKQGYSRFIINGIITPLRSEENINDLAFDKNKKHSISIVLYFSDSISLTDHGEIAHAIERSFDITKDSCLVITDDTHESLFTKETYCADCKIGFPPIDARMFSFNLPLGACSRCKGSGIIMNFGGEMSDEQSHDKFNLWVVCTECNGSRINIYARSVTINNKTIYDVSKEPVENACDFIKNIYESIDSYKKEITEKLFNEIITRLTFLIKVGLGYISLNRVSGTLSGGEGQRIRLATQIGSGLTGVTYILDEPSIGLHQKDNDKLIETLHTLKNLGNTVIVVEHDADTMRSADYLIDMGPGAGRNGGTIVSQGTPQDIMNNPLSLTGQYLIGKKSVSSLQKSPRRTPRGYITLKNASRNNLKNLTVRFPLGVLCCLSGVSGSGKSSLLLGEFAPALQDAIIKRKYLKTSEKIEGDLGIRHIVIIDQKPIGRTPRSNPATYLGIFDGIRELFSLLPESKARGYTPGTFSFNTGTGRCKECGGQGQKTISMHMLPDVVVACRTCHSTGYTPQVLEIVYKEKNISDILRMTAEEAACFFEHHKVLYRKLQLLVDVGLGYITIGQSALTFSGGEAQRIKLADELSKRGNDTIYILDEPTTGLHFDDVKKLLTVFDALIEKGNSIFVIEHNIDVLRYADYIIDVGPEGGARGGYIVCEGCPYAIKQCKKSHTGKYL
jgi:excinuclease ABC subunit A